jgi:Fic family protein
VLAKLVEGWEGPMTTRKWVAICGCSADTAQRDIAALLQRGLLRANEKGGRSRGYDFTGP